MLHRREQKYIWIQWLKLKRFFLKFCFTLLFWKWIVWYIVTLSLSQLDFHVCICPYLLETFQVAWYCIYSIVLGYLLIAFDLYARVIRYNFQRYGFLMLWVRFGRFCFHFSMGFLLYQHSFTRFKYAVVCFGDSAYPLQLLIHYAHFFRSRSCTIVFFSELLFFLARQSDSFFNGCEMVSILACNS